MAAADSSRLTNPWLRKSPGLLPKERSTPLFAISAERSGIEESHFAFDIILPKNQGCFEFFRQDSLVGPERPTGK